MYKVADYLQDYQRKEKYENVLGKIINRPFEEYHLSEIILCHGYSSVLAVQMAAYYTSRNQVFLSRLSSNVNILLKNMGISSDGISQTYYSLLENDSSLLMGITGVILSLLSTICDNMSFTKLILID